MERMHTHAPTPTISVSDEKLKTVHSFHVCAPTYPKWEEWEEEGEKKKAGGKTVAIWDWVGEEKNPPFLPKCQKRVETRRALADV